jgi:hypothetical protein
LIGRCILTFGLVEHDSQEWIAALSTDKVIKDIAFEISFRKRISLIKKLIQRTDWPEKDKDKATRLWGELDKMVETTRNTLAHNPIMMFPNAAGKQDVCVIRYKSTRTIGQVRVELLSLQDIRTKTERLSEIIKTLRQIPLN